MFNLTERIYVAQGRNSRWQDRRISQSEFERNIFRLCSYQELNKLGYKELTKAKRKLDKHSIKL